MPLTHKLIHYGKPIIKPLVKVAVLLFAIRGKYPPMLVTPDDPVSPFGSGTTPTASVEPTQMAIYKRFGRYIGDVVWLAWRNGGYGISYYVKPGWLKDPAIKYEELTFDVEVGARKTRYWLRQPDGTWLWETQRWLGPLCLITGYRIQPIFDGAAENKSRLAVGLPRAPRPGFHPNMDGRPIFSIRTRRTM
jgi:hypothetical protein